MKATLQEHWKRLGLRQAPSLHVVLGSGLSGAFDDQLSTGGWKHLGNLAFGEIEGLSATTAPGHKGLYRFYASENGQKFLCLQQGRLHGYEGLTPREVVRSVMVPRMAGTERFLLTNAAGSLDRSFKVGALMIINDHVNLTGTNPLYGANPMRDDGTPLGPRFPDMSEVYDRAMRTRLKTTLKAQSPALDVVEGTYLGLIGPTYETPAEVKLYSSWGLGSVGMSTVWEAIALKHSGARLAGLSFISNLGCGLSDEPLSHEEVEREAAKIGRRLIEAIFRYASTECEDSK